MYTHYFGFVINAIPQSQLRARHVTKLQNVGGICYTSNQTYTPEKTRKWQHLVRIKAIAEKGRHEAKLPFTGPVELNIDFFMPIPKTRMGKFKIIQERKQWMYHAIKPDLSNMEKAIEDALNGVAYKDDCQIVVKTSTKKYSEDPRVVIRVMEIGE